MKCSGVLDINTPPYVYRTHREYASWKGMRAFLAWFCTSYPPGGIMRGVHRKALRVQLWRAYIAGMRATMGANPSLTLPPL